MEANNETILNSTSSHSRNDNVSNRSVSISNPLDEVVKALGSCIEKVVNEERAMAAHEKRKLEKQMERPQKLKQKRKNWNVSNFIINPMK